LASARRTHSASIAARIWVRIFAVERRPLARRRQGEKYSPRAKFPILQQFYCPPTKRLEGFWHPHAEPTPQALRRGFGFAFSLQRNQFKSVSQFPNHKRSAVHTKLRSLFSFIPIALSERSIASLFGWQRILLHSAHLALRHHKTVIDALFCH